MKCIKCTRKICLKKWIILWHRWSTKTWKSHYLSLHKKWSYSLTLFFPMLPFHPPENIRKPKVFWCFQGDQNGTLGRKGLRKLRIWSHLLKKSLMGNFIFFVMCQCHYQEVLQRCYYKNLYWKYAANLQENTHAEGDMVKPSYELRVASYELLVTSWKLKSTSWNSKVRVQIHELRVQI